LTANKNIKTTISIVNLKCNGCVNTVRKGLLNLEGIDEIEVDLENSKISIPTDNENILSLVKKKLSKMGYPEIHDTNTVLHKAKSFVNCATGKMTL
jgi:copper chaperone CopZ